MAAPLRKKVWSVPAQQGRDLDALGRALVRRVGGPWSWNPDLQKHEAWRVRDGVRLELHLEDASGGGRSARLQAMPEGYAAAGCLPTVFGGLAVPAAIAGAVAYRALLVVAVVLLVLAGGSYVAARRVRPRDEAEMNRQFTEAVAQIDEALAQPR